MIGNGDKRKATDIDSLEKITFQGLVKRLHSLGIISKSYGMNDTVNGASNSLTNLITNSNDILLLFHVTGENLTFRKKFAGCFSTLFTANHVNYLSTVLLKYLCDMTGDRFFIGKTKNNYCSL